MRRLLLLALLLGCDDAGTTPAAEAPDAAAPDATVEAVVRPRLAMLDSLDITREMPGRVALGFDLDGRVSDHRDDESCRNPDYTSPDGEPGIDNQLAILTPALDAAGADALPGLIRNSIRDGGLLVLLQLDGVDDQEDDDEVTLTLRIGDGRPLLGTDGELLSGQTFALAADSPDTVAESAWIEDGWLTAGPFELQLPIGVFDLLYRVTLRGAWLRARLTYDGGLAEGIIAGGIPVAELLEVARVADSRVGGDPFSTLLGPILRREADLERDADGVCQAISGTFTFSAVSAFLYE